MKNKKILDAEKLLPYMSAEPMVDFFSRFQYPNFVFYSTILILIAVHFIIKKFTLGFFDFEDLKYLIGFAIALYFLRWRLKLSKEKRLIIFYFMYCLFYRFILSIAFLIGALLVFKNGLTYWVYPFLIGLVIFPILEFLRPALKHLTPIFILRIIVIVYACFNWSQWGGV